MIPCAVCSLSIPSTDTTAEASVLLKNGVLGGTRVAVFALCCQMQPTSGDIFAARDTSISFDAQGGGARSASSFIAMGRDIVAAELVATFAVCLPSLIRRWAGAAQCVFALRYWLQMIRIAARRVPAQMVQMKPIGNRTDAHDVSGSVRSDRRLGFFSANGAIAQRVFRARIWPALKWFVERCENVTFNDGHLAHLAIYNPRTLGATTT